MKIILAKIELGWTANINKYLDRGCVIFRSACIISRSCQGTWPYPPLLPHPETSPHPQLQHCKAVCECVAKNVKYFMWHTQVRCTYVRSVDLRKCLLDRDFSVTLLISSPACLYLQSLGKEILKTAGKCKTASKSIKTLWLRTSVL
jgi:hypothetical protein